jgi:uncharacterized protein YbjT (DUF2867 family)
MSLLVIGATGTLGRQVVRHALDRGLKVRCLVRIPKKASFLREWGAELVQGSLIKPETLTEALEDITQVIDAATTRATDSLRIKAVDWDGKVALIQAAERAKIEKFVFFSIMNAELYPQVPLMEIKHCTENFLQKTDLNYTILRPCGFMQGLIGQYAIPILENETIWVTGESTPVAYMNTQDVAKFAVRSLSVPETARQTYGIGGTRTWSPSEILRQCERLSGRTARSANMPIGLLRAFKNTILSFEWGWNISERMAFAEVLASGTPLAADMTETYRVFGIDPDSITTLESYLQEYFSRILRKLKELDYKEPKIKTPF